MAIVFAGRTCGRRLPALDMGRARRSAVIGEDVPQWIAPWDTIRRKYDLTAPGLETFVGLSFQYADYSMRYGQTES
jgi:hypothetical protein